MTDHDPSAGHDPARLQAADANDTSCPKGFLERLAQFAERTGTTPPAQPFEEEGDERTFSTEFLAYCQATGLSLDWVYFGDAMPLAMRAHNATKKEADPAVKSVLRKLESALADLANVRETLALSSYWSISQLSNDQPLGRLERDALIGAVDATGWAVERVQAAWDAEWNALSEGAK